MNETQAVRIQIVTGDSRAIFKQIVDGIRMEIATGNLKAGNKLPSYRGLAMQLTINPNTVAKAYAELTSLGLIEARKGLGLFVAEKRQILSNEEQKVRLNKAITNFINETVDLEFSEAEMLSELKNRLSKISNNKKEDSHE